jgi:hypothetical protein
VQNGVWQPERMLREGDCVPSGCHVAVVLSRYTSNYYLILYILLRSSMRRCGVWRYCTIIYYIMYVNHRRGKKNRISLCAATTRYTGDRARCSRILSSLRFFLNTYNIVRICTTSYYYYDVVYAGSLANNNKEIVSLPTWGIWIVSYS